MLSMDRHFHVHLEKIILTRFITCEPDVTMDAVCAITVQMCYVQKKYLITG